jgi:hypothetical protein
MGRIVLAVVVALIVAFAVVSISQMLTAYVVPPPSSEVLKDPAAIRQYMMSVPPMGYIMVVIGWIVGAFAAGFVVTKMTRRESPGITLPIVVGALMTLGAILNFIVLPHPTWFVIVGLLVFIPSSLVAHRFAR